MRKIIPHNPLLLYVCIICFVAISEAFAVKPTVLPLPVNTYKHENISVPVEAKPSIPFSSSALVITKDEPVMAEADSIDFNVEVVQSRKFFLSFTKKREETIFIKIYDVIGNLIHHEVVSKKGKFRKQYDLSRYKTDLYVIEVGSGNTAKVKRLFLG